MRPIEDPGADQNRHRVRRRRNIIIAVSAVSATLFVGVAGVLAMGHNDSRTHLPEPAPTAVETGGPEPTATPDPTVTPPQPGPTVESTRTDPGPAADVSADRFCGPRDSLPEPIVSQDGWEGFDLDGDGVLDGMATYYDDGEPMLAMVAVAGQEEFVSGLCEGGTFLPTDGSGG